MVSAVSRRLWADDGLLFPYRIGEELPTKRPLYETWLRICPSYGWRQTKFRVSSMLPMPLYFAVCG